MGSSIAIGCLVAAGRRFYKNSKKMKRLARKKEETGKEETGKEEDLDYDYYDIIQRRLSSSYA
jgi:hypothetical protein